MKFVVKTAIGGHPQHSLQISCCHHDSMDILALVRLQLP